MVRGPQECNMVQEHRRPAAAAKAKRKFFCRNFAGQFIVRRHEVGPNSQSIPQALDRETLCTQWRRKIRWANWKFLMYAFGRI